VYASVDQNLGDIVRLSPVLAELGESGKVMFLGAVYQLDTGKVNFSDRTVLRWRQGSTAATAVSAWPER
jgi:hypothetical protein